MQQQPARAEVWVGVFALIMALTGCTHDEPLPQQGPAEHGGKAYAGTGYAADDAAMVQRVRSELARDPVIGAVAINVHAADGRVHLRGFVASTMQRVRAEEIAQSVNGVTHVDNRLITRARSGAADGPLAAARLYL